MYYPSPNPKRLPVIRVIKGALRLYKDNFKSYVRLSFIASLWVLPSIFAIIPIAIIAGILVAILGTILSGWVYGLISVLVVLTAIVGWFLVLAYCASKSLLNSALISKLAYQLLENKPNSVSTTRQRIKSLNWVFWWTQFLVGLLLGLINLGLSLLGFVIFELPGYFISSQVTSSFISLIGSVITTIIYLFFVMRLSIPDTVIAIEEINDSYKALEKSWELTKSYVGKIGLIFVGVFLITIPVYVISLIPLLITLITNLAILQNIHSADLSSFSLVFGLAFLVTILLFLCLNIMALPLWQCIKAVIYYDIFPKQSSTN